MENLSKRKPDKEQEEVKELRQKVHKKRMEKNDDDDFLIGKDDFDEVLNKFSTKNTKTYDFLLKASNCAKNSLRTRSSKRFSGRRSSS